MTHDFDNLMGLALAQAQHAKEKSEVPVGAVIVDSGGQIVAAAHNLRESRCDPVAHAELLAIREAAANLGRWRLHDCTLVVTLEPCPMCAGAIVNARLPQVVFGTSDPRAGAAGTVFNLVNNSYLNHQAQVIAGVRAEACGRILSDFFAARRRRK